VDTRYDNDAVNLLAYAYSISAYFPAFAGFLPRMTDLLTAGHADQIACPVEAAKLNSKERPLPFQHVVVFQQKILSLTLFVDARH